MGWFLRAILVVMLFIASALIANVTQSGKIFAACLLIALAFLIAVDEDES